MNDIRDLLPNRMRERTFQLKAKRDAGAVWHEPQFVECKQCGRRAARTLWGKSLYVCPNCGYHMPIGGYYRLSLVLDHGSFRELDADLDPQDVLNFPGYGEKLAAAMPKRYRKLRGDTAYYPFAARTGLRARQRRHVRVLRGAGLAALALAAVLLVRQTVFRGGQPDAPAAVPTAPAVTALPAPTHVTVQPLAATRDALADTQRADASAHATPETAAVPAAAAGEILPRYRALYEKNPDLIGWLRIDGTDIDLPVVQTPGDNEYYLRRGFDRFYAVGGTLFLDERCSVSTDAPTANWLIYGHNMHDGSMFGQLVRYRDEDFYKAHPTFTFDTLYEGGTWQVVAAVDTALGADTLPYYTFFDADTKLDWQHRVRAITEKALYDTGVMPEYGAQLLTLSTCGDTRPDTDARFALLAVRID